MSKSVHKSQRRFSTSGKHLHAFISARQHNFCALKTVSYAHLSRWCLLAMCQMWLLVHGFEITTQVWLHLTQYLLLIYYWSNDSRMYFSEINWCNNVWSPNIVILANGDRTEPTAASPSRSVSRHKNLWVPKKTLLQLAGLRCLQATRFCTHVIRTYTVWHYCSDLWFKTSIAQCWIASSCGVAVACLICKTVGAGSNPVRANLLQVGCQKR